MPMPMANVGQKEQMINDIGQSLARRATRTLKTIKVGMSNGQWLSRDEEESNATAEATARQFLLKVPFG